MLLSRARIPALARDRTFLALWSAQSVSVLGDALTTLTLILLLTQRSGSVAAVGGLTVVLAVPGVALGLLSGVCVDRWNRRATMIAGDTARAALLIALAVVVTQTSGLLGIYLIAGAQAVVGTFFEPARAALLQVVVPAAERVRANSLLSSTVVAAELGGTTLAGVLSALWHRPAAAFVLDAGTFAASALLVLAVPAALARPVRGAGGSARSDLIAGVRVVRRSPTLRALLLVFGALTFVLAPMTVLLTPYIVDTLHQSAAWLGPIQAGDTIGNLAGGLVLAVLARRIRPGALVVTGLFGLTAVLVLFSVTSTVAGLIAVYGAFGLLSVAVQTGVGALIQDHVDNAVMGRFVALLGVGPGVVSVLSMGLTGTAGAALGIRPVLLLSGAVLAVATAGASRRLCARPRSASGPLGGGQPGSRAQPHTVGPTVPGQDVGQPR